MPPWISFRIQCQIMFASYQRKHYTPLILFITLYMGFQANHPWLTEIPAPDGGPGSDITNEGLKLQTKGGQ